CERAVPQEPGPKTATVCFSMISSLIEFFPLFYHILEDFALALLGYGGKIHKDRDEGINS
ncbi:TPA: hypothetical protein ACL0GZ_002577, partial [Streptococcus pneumoniae]